MDLDLRTVLSNYPARARPWDDPIPLGNAGGLSGSRLWRYQSGQGPLTARAWPIDGPPPAQLDRVHHWLNEASRVGFVPVPVLDLDGRSYREHSGRIWELTPWLSGAADGDSPPAAPHVRAAFVALAVFHQALRCHRIVSPSPGILLRFEELKGLVSGGLAEIVRAIAKRSADPLKEPASQWVDLVRKSSGEMIKELARASTMVIDRQPILRDARPEHFLFDGDRVSGLVDFGAMGVDTVAADLSRLASEWFDPGDLTRRDLGLNAYSAIRPITLSEHLLFHVFQKSTLLLGPGRWVRWHFLEERVFNDSQAVSRGLKRGVERLISAIGEISPMSR